jgi:hypothetical protein
MAALPLPGASLKGTSSRFCGTNKSANIARTIPTRQPPITRPHHRRDQQLPDKFNDLGGGPRTASAAFDALTCGDTPR